MVKLQKLTEFQNLRELQTFCQENREPQVQDLCKRYQDRPHLLAQPEKSENTRIQNNESPCPDQKDELRCREKRAKQAKNHLEVKNECNAIQLNKLRADCFFSTAEHWAASGKPYKEAAALCKMAMGYSDKCLQHLSIQIATSGKSLKDIDDMAKEIQTHWDQKNNKRTQIELEIFWFTYLEIEYEKGTQLSGNLFSELPKLTHPHLHSLFADALFQTQRDERSLEAWTELILEHKKMGKILKYPKREQRLQRWAHGSRPSGKSSKSNSRFPMISYFNQGKRFSSQDEKVDIQLALLEASKTHKRHLNLKTEAESSKHAVLRFSAEGF